MDRQSHWQGVYGTKSDTAMSWYQPHAERSLEFIRSRAPDRDASIIDVGGGASTLVDDLLVAGYTDITVLDIAAAALTAAKARLAANAGKVEWIAADITQWAPARTWKVWHDRAVFHFLTEARQQDAYLRSLEEAIRPGSSVIMATFALDGPERCSGLPVQRYSPALLAARLGALFAPVTEAHEMHVTPWGTRQSFSYVALERV